MNKIRNLKLVIAIVFFTLLLGIFGSVWLYRSMTKLYFDESKNEFEYIQKFIKENAEVNNYLIKYGYKISENTAKNFAFLLREKLDANSITKDDLVEININEEIDNIIILDKTGNVITSINDIIFDFKDEKFDGLRKVFDENEKSTTFEIKNNSVTDYYFAAKINDNIELLVYCDGRRIESDSRYILNWQNILLDKGANRSINYFVLEKESDKVIYSAIPSNIGKNLGINKKVLSKDEYKFVTVLDKWGFAKIVPLDNVDLVSFIYLDTILRRPLIYMFFVLLTFLICIIFIASYSLIVSEEANLLKEGFGDKFDISKYEDVRKKKIHIATILSAVVMAVVIVFFGNIFSIANADEITDFYYNKIKNHVNRAEANTQSLNEMYDSYCKINNNFINLILEKYPDKKNKDDLDKIAKSLGLEGIRILDLSGTTICTSNGLDKYKLSNDKEDPSYKCWDLIAEDGFVMFPVTKGADKNLYQYVCSTHRDENHNIAGIIMTKYIVSEKQKIEEMIDWYKYIQDIAKEVDINYYIINKSKDEYIEDTNMELVLQNSKDVTLPVAAIQNSFQGFVNYNGKDFFGKTIQIDDIVIGFFADLNDEMTLIIFDIMVIVIMTFILLFLYMKLVITISKDANVERKSIDVDNNKSVAIVKMLLTNWSKKTGSQKISLLISYLFIAIMIIFSIILLYGKRIFGENSIINYIINGNWYRSFNVLALGKSVLIVSYIFLVALVTNKMLLFISKSFDARGVTICRLLMNFVQYAAIFVALYQCLSLYGVDTKTLIASAGILSLVVGFGANKLIQEVVSGLFIIFEGALQVGDTVTIGNFSGVVKEIGIRNTKVESVDGNVMIMSNSKMDNVINHSTAKTFIVYEYKIPKEISLDVCDEFFNDKLDYLKEKFGTVVKSIKYDGIVECEKETYTIRFSISCIDENKVKIEYKIDEEMKLLINELSNKI